MVSYVVKDSWTKHNQFTAELFLHWDQAHRNEELKKTMLKNSNSQCAGHWHTISLGTNCQGTEISARWLDNCEIPATTECGTPELCCGTGSCRSQGNCISSLKEGLKCWVYHLYRGENSDQPSKFSFERNTSEGGGTQNRRQRFLFVCAEYTCIFTLFEQQKKKKGKKKKDNI